MPLINIPDHCFTTAIITFVLFIALCLIAPPFLIFKFIQAIIVRCFASEENMAGKVVLITGASSGIGEYMAYEYARRKASLVIVARREKQLREVSERARKLGSPKVVCVYADVSKIDDCKKFVDEAIKQFGRLDHLVNNAGIGSVCAMEDIIDVLKFAPVMDVNFWGSIYPTHAALPHLRRTKGRIIVNSSAAALLSPPKATFYNASKSALISFYESLRTELAPREIKVTIVVLGFVESEMTRGKYLYKEGNVELRNHVRKDVIQSWPVMSTEPCAKAIVEGACKGLKYVTEPQFLRPLFAFRFLCPEIVDCYYRYLYLPSQQSI